MNLRCPAAQGGTSERCGWPLSTSAVDCTAPGCSVTSLRTEGACTGSDTSVMYDVGVWVDAAVLMALPLCNRTLMGGSPRWLTSS